jgi:hypothetical protein
VPLSEGGGCRYWRLRRTTLQGLRAAWAAARVAARVALLRHVPVLSACLSDAELHQVGQ